MTTPGAPYRDRREAGERLSDVLAFYHRPPLTVVALPRGGVPVASVIAERLAAPLDILVVRKVGAPGNPEYGLGAVAEDGVEYLDRRRVEELGLRPEDLAPEVRRQTDEVAHVARRLRDGRAMAPVEGRTVILVDDGMATGGTVRCAVAALRLRRPSRIVLAVGVSSREALDELRPRVDALVCPLVPPMLFAVGEWYRSFPQVADADVQAILRHRRDRAAVDLTAA